MKLKKFSKQFPHAFSTWLNGSDITLEQLVELSKGNGKEVWEPDWNRAPKWAIRLLIDDDGKSWWSIGKKDELVNGGWSSQGKFQPFEIIKNAPKNYYEWPQDDIDWSLLPEQANWIAIDSISKNVFAYETKPYIGIEQWFVNGGAIYELDASHLGEKYLKTLWYDSLRKRPKGK